MHRFIDIVFARWKWVLSFFKKEWLLADYPVRFRRQTANPNDLYQPPRFILHPWNVSIVGLWISGHGATKLEALANLENNFQDWKEKRLARGESMIRPGKQAPVEYAPTERIQAHEELAQDFIERVLGHDWAFISDQSSLGDFHTERSNDALVAKFARCTESTLPTSSLAGSLPFWNALRQNASGNPGPILGRPPVERSICRC